MPPPRPPFRQQHRPMPMPMKQRQGAPRMFTPWRIIKKVDRKQGARKMTVVDKVNCALAILIAVLVLFWYTLNILMVPATLVAAGASGNPSKDAPKDHHRPRRQDGPGSQLGGLKLLIEDNPVEFGASGYRLPLMIVSLISCMCAAVHANSRSILTKWIATIGYASLSIAFLLLAVQIILKLVVTKKLYTKLPIHIWIFSMLNILLPFIIAVLMLIASCFVLGSIASAGNGPKSGYWKSPGGGGGSTVVHVDENRSRGVSASKARNRGSIPSRREDERSRSKSKQQTTNRMEETSAETDNTYAQLERGSAEKRMIESAESE